jgi:ABC-type antimicrobial peptide transport system permease subunit
VLSIDLGLGQHGYTPAAARAYLDQIQSRLRAVPGVKSVALVRLAPMGHTISRIGTDLGGHPVDIYPNWVEPGFFETMSIPLQLGRNLLPGEKNAVVVSESLARKQWPGQDPLGKQFQTGEGHDIQKDTVVGVAGNARVNSINDGDAVELYWPAQEVDMPGMVVIVKSARAPEGITLIVRAIAQDLDPKLFPEIRQLKGLYHDNVSLLEKVAMVVSLIGMIAILIAGVGIIGLVTYSVSQRTKEIAIRLALGAKPWHVLSIVLSQFLWPVALGLIGGVAVAAAFSRLLRQVLFGVSNLDAASYAGAVGLLIVIASGAALMPAKRALGVDPMRALHHE